jgi:hypothetical protein
MNSYLNPRVEDRVKSFFRIVPITDLTTGTRLGEQKRNLEETLRNCGLIPKRSDFIILDHSRIGECTITIARYALDYVDDGDTTGKTVSIDGSVAIKIDNSGNRDILLSLKTYPFGPIFDSHSAGTTPFGNKNG